MANPFSKADVSAAYGFQNICFAPKRANGSRSLISG